MSTTNSLNTSIYLDNRVLVQEQWQFHTECTYRLIRKENII